MKAAATDTLPLMNVSTDRSISVQANYLRVSPRLYNSREQPIVYSAPTTTCHQQPLYDLCLIFSATLHASCLLQHASCGLPPQWKRTSLLLVVLMDTIISLHWHIHFKPFWRWYISRSLPWGLFLIRYWKCLQSRDILQYNNILSSFFVDGILVSLEGSFSV